MITNNTMMIRFMHTYAHAFMNIYLGNMMKNLRILTHITKLIPGKVVLIPITANRL